MSKFIWLTPIVWNGSEHVEGKYKLAVNVNYIREFTQTDCGYSLLTTTDAPAGIALGEHKFKESAGQIMSMIVED
jgi:hypothetical protein